MGKSPKLAQVSTLPTVPASAPKLLRHCLNSESASLEKRTLLLQDEGQSEGIKCKVFAGTWNVGGAAPPDDLDLTDWLDLDTKAGSLCDIYVLGFQEIVPLNVRNVLGPKKRSAAMKWRSLIGDALNNRGRRQQGDQECMEDRQWRQDHQGGDLFGCVVSKQMVGIFVSVWARSGLRRHVRHPGVSCVGAGVLGLLGNKGAVTVRFVLQATGFCFVCCHLASGSGRGDALRRNADAGNILSRTRFHGRCRAAAASPAPAPELPRKILDHDSHYCNRSRARSRSRVVLLGDLNYRVAMDDAEARVLVAAGKWGMLLENDELLFELYTRGRRFDGWREGLVIFAPTYKYHRGSDQLCWRPDAAAATGRCRHHKQHRTPAWCDRVLWRGKGMSQTLYESCGGYRLSDHRPVRAVFHAVCDDVVDGQGSSCCIMGENESSRLAKVSALPFPSLFLSPEQSETVSYRVFAGTWNVGGVAPPDGLDLEDWLDTKASSYDIYVLGFQEMVPLNARNVLGPKQRSAAMRWQLLIGDALNHRRSHEEDTFRCAMSKQMVGIFVSVWTRSSLRRHLRCPGVSSVGAGVLGRLGNKGAVSVRFLLHGTSFCFVCCHLASGGDARRRNADAADILWRTSFLDSGGAAAALPKKILDHDRVVLLGDLNYRVAMDDAGEARQLVRARKWGMLLEHDELLLELATGRQFDGWSEGRVTFAPTYKYHRNSDEFYWRADGGGGAPGVKKQHRAPAWCDRILWRGKGMRQVRYERCGGYRLSDHRPVRAVFHAVCEREEGVGG
ncbi:hypothetical protein U9M48_038926 [Paspalum notatum var. saurae]|uniref:Inositol polyphosphate-related phosphatase domain-containing protein n=1 Tax=Paspalum notatum var. saurae TaxID=547442 RepID=A0AAQ3XCI8_PASNO